MIIVKQHDKNSIIDNDINKERALDPVVKCTNELKSEFRTQVLKLYYYPDKDDWNFQFNTINNAKKILKME